MNILVKTKRLGSHLFLTYEADDGRKEYYLDNQLVTKEQGNNVYLDMKRTDNIKEVIHITSENKQSIIDFYMRGYDEYADYIENGRQWRQAVDNNEEILRSVKLIEKCVK